MKGVEDGKSIHLDPAWMDSITVLAVDLDVMERHSGTDYEIKMTELGDATMRTDIRTAVGLGNNSMEHVMGLFWNSWVC